MAKYIPKNINRKHMSRRNAPVNINLGGEKLHMQGLTRKQRNKLIDSAAVKHLGKGNMMANRAITGLNTLAGILAGAAETGTSLKNEAQRTKMREISRMIDSFMDDLGKMSPEQLNALAPTLAAMNKHLPQNNVSTNMGKPKPPSGTGEPGGTLIM